MEVLLVTQEFLRAVLVILGIVGIACFIPTSDFKVRHHWNGITEITNTKTGARYIKHGDSCNLTEIDKK